MLYLPWGWYQPVSVRVNRNTYSCDSWLIYKELLDACPSQWTSDRVFLRLDWSGLMLSSFPCPESYLLKASQPNGVSFWSDIALSHTAPNITAHSHSVICAHTKIFLWPTTIFNSRQYWDRRDHSTSLKEIWLQRSSTGLSMMNLFLWEPVNMSQSCFRDMQQLLSLVRGCLGRMEGWDGLMRVDRIKLA